MNSATQRGPFVLGQRRRAASPDRRDEPRRCDLGGLGRSGRRAQQRPRPVGVPLAHGGAAPGASCSSVRQSSATGSATIAAGSGPPKRSRQPSSGAASTNWPSHQDRSPRPDGGLAATPSRCMPRRTRADASTWIGPDCRRPYGPGRRRCGPAVPSGPPARSRAARTAARRPSRGRCGCGPTAPVQGTARRPPKGPRATSPGTSAGPRPARWPRSRPAGPDPPAGRGGAAPSAPRPAPRTGPPPTVSHAPRGSVGAGQLGRAADAAERELPVVVEPRQPQGARPGQGEGGGPQIRPGAGGVEQRGQQRLGGAVAVLAGGGQPLGQQLGEIGRRAAPTAAGRCRRGRRAAGTACAGPRAAGGAEGRRGPGRAAHRPARGAARRAGAPCSPRRRPAARSAAPWPGRTATGGVAPLRTEQRGAHEVGPGGVGGRRGRRAGCRGAARCSCGPWSVARGRAVHRRVVVRGCGCSAWRPPGGAREERRPSGPGGRGRGQVTAGRRRRWPCPGGERQETAVPALPEDRDRRATGQ